MFLQFIDGRLYCTKVVRQDLVEACTGLVGIIRVMFLHSRKAIVILWEACRVPLFPVS